MRIKTTVTEALIGSDDMGFTHLCPIAEYYEPYIISAYQAQNAKSAGVITEEEYQQLIST